MYNKQRFVSKQSGTHWIQELATEYAVAYPGAPSSGTSGTLAGHVRPGGLLLDATNGVLFVNEGTKASPYWTPVSLSQRPLFGVESDFRDQVGKAVADTGTEAIIAGSGLRVFGQGIAETDSGLVVQAAGEGGCVARLTTTDEADHVAAIGMEAGVMQPDQHQLLVVDVEYTNVSAITLRNVFLGFVGTAADALDPPVTGATTTATLVQDDLCLMHFDVGYTDGDRWYVVYNKSNAAATMTPDDTSVDVAAAATYQRLRVEVDVAGNATFFINKAQVEYEALALDDDEECSPVFGIESTSAATKSVDIKHFAAWAYR